MAGEFAEVRGERLEIDSEVVLGSDGLNGCVGDGCAKAGGGDEALEGEEEGIRVARGDQETGLAVADKLRNSRSEGGDAGDAEGHGFHEGDGEPLMKGGKEKDICGGHALKRVLVGEGTGPLDGICDAELGSQVLEDREFRAAADEGEAGRWEARGEAGPEESEGLEEDAMALEGDESGGANELKGGGGFTRGAGAKGLEGRKLNAEAADLDFVSGLGGDTKDLAAGVVADDEDG